MEHLDRLRQHFNESVDAFDLHYHRKPPTPRDLTVRRRRDLTLDFLHQHVPRQSLVFDAGCGPGGVALSAAVIGYRVHGMDLAEGMVDRARQNVAGFELDEDRCRFEVGDVLGHSHDWHSYDAVVALDFLQYQTNPSSALLVLARLLKPGGTLIVSVPNRIRLSNYFGLWELGRLVQRLVKQRVLAETVPEPLADEKYNTERVERLLGTVGFTMMDYRRHGYSGFSGGWLSARQEFILGSLIEGLPQLLPFIPNDRFADDIVAVARTCPQDETS